MNRFRIVENDEVDFMIESARKGMHKTLEGHMVPLGSPECRDDILKRMDDAGYFMNDYERGSDARSYFSGVRKVLRRKLKENDKFAENSEKEEASEEIMSESTNKKRAEEQDADRILKLAGILR